ncbi:myogenesis-regulating glycosidase-like [Daktulosphaira vitifoliae]|uniref:myogenesis-regulating glycosidase-like n=1 Tax=Daktulosphaira vitifoliae TaxID=58002 RepID=UPI0021AABA1B|nr:myogenesis-regulating glycosidase-like [Daktulosphaira vitifoliae]
MHYLLIFSVIIQISFCVFAREPETYVLFTNRKNELNVKRFGKFEKTSKQLLLTSFVENDDVETTDNNNGGNINILNYKTSSNSKECMDFDHLANNINTTLKVCVDLGNSLWFGGPERSEQLWPLNKFRMTEYPFVSTGEVESQAVLESYFLSSDGFYIHIDDSVPLFLDINGQYTQEKMCFTSKVQPPYRKTENRLKYRVCRYENAKIAHQKAINDVLGKPNSAPSSFLVKNPIWSTWAKYKTKIDSQKVLDYANQIVDNGYPKGQLEIDDDWETCYGSAEFNQNKFPYIKKLVSTLHDMGFQVSLWVHPFVQMNCDVFNELLDKKYFVNSTNGIVNTKWWNGVAGHIDFTNPYAARWWSNRLFKLLDYTKIDTLKFDAGESTWCPQLPVYYNNDLTYYPDNIVNAYIDTISQFGDRIEYRTARRVQKQGKFVRMIDRESRWNWKLGLQSLVTALLHFNMVGYPYVLPDMIGGNVYNDDKISEELFIRWMQANTFMPVVQFSIPPWDFGEKTAKICKKFWNLHLQYADVIVKLMENAVKNGDPINPPIWWIDPNDPTAFSIDDEFLLGEDILVAPVMVQNATKRNIYLPAGKWKDMNNPNEPLIDGKIWVYDYAADIEILPWFIRMNDEEEKLTSSASKISDFNQLKFKATIFVILMTLISYFL